MYYYHLHPEQPQFPLGEGILDFLARERTNRERLHVLQGIYGDLVMSGDKVKLMFEGGGQEEWDLATFLQSIRALLATTHH